MDSDSARNRSSQQIAVQDTYISRLRRRILGAPRDLRDKSVYHAMTLAPFLAWIGLGSDALSSSAYGPEESFKAIGEHRSLAIALAAATALTVCVISAAYAKLIEHFPNGGGYGVASRTLGRHAGLISGCALLIDYVLTIAISIAAAGDAIFSFLPTAWQTVHLAPWLDAKLAVELGVVAGLTTLNLRGVRESVLVLMPFFVLFLVTHALLVVGGIAWHVADAPVRARELSTEFHQGVRSLGWLGLLGVFMHAYSLGGGTYTGIEAVSNALPVMREPQVQTAKRTMLYLAVSLALTAGGLLVCFLLWRVVPTDGKTLNAVLFEAILHGVPGGGVVLVLALVAEATLLIVAAQAGFMGGPRVTANMAVDSWLPHGFSTLSERLTIENGIMIMGGLSLAVVAFTGGSVATLVVMYSINVFLTFSLTMAGMVRFWWQRRTDRKRAKRLALFAGCFLLCATILVVTVWTKFEEGAWKTLGATAAMVVFCLLVRRHYRLVQERAATLYRQFGDLPLSDEAAPPLNPSQPTAIILVGAYGALGIHTLLNALRVFPGHFANAVFVSVGVMDSGAFKGEDTVDELRTRTEGALKQYQRLSTGLGLPSAYHFAVGTDAVDEAEKLCLKIAKLYPRSVFFAGKLIFEDERWYHRLLHNNTAHAVQKRLHWAGRAMVIMPARMN